MKKDLDLQLIEKFRESLNKDKVKKTTNILFNKGILDASFNASSNKINNNSFRTDLVGLPVEDQGMSGRCWIFAATNLIREQLAKKFGTDDFCLSNSYLAFWDKLERANFFLESIIENIHLSITDRLFQFLIECPIEDAGQWDMVVNLIEKYGVVPNYVMPDNFHAFNTKEINYILNWKLREFAIKLHENKNLKEEELRNKKDEYIFEIYKILKTFYGNPVETFDFEYSLDKKNNSDYPYRYKDFSKQYNIEKNLTPLEFYKKFVDVKLSEFVSIINVEQDKKPFYKAYSLKYINNIIEKKSAYHINLPKSFFILLIAFELIYNKNPVWFGSDVSWYLNKQNGKWDDKQFDVDIILNTSFKMNKGDELSYKVSSMSHAMLLMGINYTDLNIDFYQNKSTDEKTLLDQINNKISSWKVQNSWGSYIGNWGYFTMSQSWFEKYVFQAVIKKETLLKFWKWKTNNEIKSLDEIEVINLDPWDEIGVLASNKTSINKC